MNRNCAFGIILILCLSLLNLISVENHRRSHISLGFDGSELGSGSSSLQSYIPNEVGVYPGEVFRYHNQTTVVASNLTHVMLIDVVAERIIATHECAGWTITHGSIAFVLSDNRSQVLCSGRILEITTNLNGILSFFQLKTGSFHQTYRINNGEWLDSNCSPQNTVVLTFHLNNSLVKTIDYSNCGSVYSGDPLIVNGTEEFGLVSAVGAFYPVLYDTDLPFGVGDAMSGRCPTFTNAESHRNHFSSSSWNFGIFASETSDLRNCVVYIGDDNSWISFVADPSSIVNDASAWRDDCFIASTTTATYLNGTKVAGSSQTSDCLDSNRYLYKSGSSLIVIDVDSDNDGVIDIKDSFPFDATQNLDSDNDGYGDSANGSQPDGCVLGFGNSSEDVFGCPDTDGDGYSDNGDAFPRENSQWNDSDNDGFGDNQNGFRHDACPNVFGSSVRNDTYGCHDADFDGWADFQDHFPNESSQWKDSDGDGYGDEFNGFEGDDCILTTGKSYIDRFGCSDGDGDGVSDKNDAFPNNPSQTDDRDSDGYGDNQSENATQIDRFPDDATQDTDSDGDGYGDNAVGNRGDRFPNDPNEWEDTDGDDVGNNEDAFPFLSILF